MSSSFEGTIFKRWLLPQVDRGDFLFPGFEGVVFVFMF